MSERKFARKERAPILYQEKPRTRKCLLNHTFYKCYNIKFKIAKPEINVSKYNFFLNS